METEQDLVSPCRLYLRQRPRLAGPAWTARCAEPQHLDWQLPDSQHCHASFCWYDTTHHTMANWQMLWQYGQKDTRTG